MEDVVAGVIDEARTVFADDLAGIGPDPDHSSLDEARELIAGQSSRSRFLLVSFVEYGDVVRIISARLLTRFERRLYEEESSPETTDDDLRPEYGPDFFKNMKPNRFAGMAIARPIYLDEDVAEVFDSSEAVNSVLRSAIKAMRKAAPKRASPKRSTNRKVS